jgi:hypothetical protein
MTSTNTPATGHVAWDSDLDRADVGDHRLRDLRGVHDSDPAARQWAEVMAGTLLMAMTASGHGPARRSNALRRTAA